MLAIAAATVGIDDNLLGILLAFLAATDFILAFVHPWRTAKMFMFLPLASVLGFVLFIILNIFLDLAAQVQQPQVRSRICYRAPLSMPSV